MARDLLGRHLIRETGGERLVLRIVETEAYMGGPDRASHAWGGRKTSRNASLYLPGGHWYLYRVYGIHWCLNATAGGKENGQAVLIRGGAPMEGVQRMASNRGLAVSTGPGTVAGGPGKICQALRLDGALDGAPMGKGLWVARGSPVPEGEVAKGPRIGVGYAGEAADWPLRFAIGDHPEMSRPRLGYGIG